MTKDELIRDCPELYHMSEIGSWPSVLEHGLLSTTALLDLFEYNGATRAIIESNWRKDKITICNKKYGSAIIRDQKPMPPDSLKLCLENGLLPEDWYKLINSKVFFWVSRDRLERLVKARAYFNQPQWIITVKTKPLVEKYYDQITLAPINAGFSILGHAMRGNGTFKTIADWTSKTPIVEFAVNYSVPDIINYVSSVVEWVGCLDKGKKVCKTVKTIWP